MKQEIDNEQICSSFNRLFKPELDEIINSYCEKYGFSINED